MATIAYKKGENTMVVDLRWDKNSTVDRILEIEPFKSATGLKNITMNEPQFLGHFPNNPIMPGVLLFQVLSSNLHPRRIFCFAAWKI